MTAHTQVPGDVADFGHKLADLVASSSDGHLVGAYLHGSAALGGWVATRSDVDILIVLRDPRAGDNAHSCRAGACRTRSRQPRNRARVQCGDPRTGSQPERSLAVPCARCWLHMERQPVQFAGTRWRVTVTFSCTTSSVEAAGFALVGPDPREVFGSVPRAVVLAYLVDELRWGIANAPAAYAVLNACRALIFANHGDLVSKIAGGQIAVDRRLGPVGMIASALDEQRALSEPRPISPEATAFVEQVIRTLDSRALRPGG